MVRIISTALLGHAIGDSYYDREVDGHPFVPDILTPEERRAAKRVAKDARPLSPNYDSSYALPLDCGEDLDLNDGDY